MKTSVYKSDLKDAPPSLHLDEQEAWGTHGNSGGRQQDRGARSAGRPRGAGHGCCSPRCRAESTVGPGQRLLSFLCLP